MMSIENAMYLSQRFILGNAILARIKVCKIYQLTIY